MSKVCFIGPYAQNDGWGRAAQDYGIALSRMSDHDVYFKRVQTIRGMDCIIPSEIISREIEEFNVPDHGFDVIIQNFLPSNFVKIPNTKNIGLFYSETINFAGMDWIEKCNDNMDAIIVPTQNEYNNIIGDGTTCPVYKVTMPMELVNNKIEKNKEFTFYYIGEFNDRKNIEYTIVEYLAAFTKSDNTVLLIKTSNCNTQAYLDYFNKKYRIFTENSPKLRIINDYLSDNEIQDIHDKSHCFVSGSKGESTCRPLIQALGCNNYAIVTGNTGMTDSGFIGNLYTIESQIERCCTLNPPISNIYNGLQFWRSPLSTRMSRIMRKLYTKSHKSSQDNKSELIRNKHRHQTVTARLNSIINEVIGV